MTDHLDDVSGGVLEPAAETSASDEGPSGELDRLRLALLHERSRAEAAERELAELRAELERSAGQPLAAPAPAGTSAVVRRPRRLRRRR
jgi:hypothetical protein